MYGLLIFLSIGLVVFAKGQPTSVQIRSPNIGKAAFQEEHFPSRNVSYCSVKITDFGGWSGIFGPWSESCDELTRLDGKWQVADDENTASVLIDPSTMSLEFSNRGSNHRFGCKLTGLAAGDGCTSPYAVLQPTKRTVPIPCTTTFATVPAGNGEDPIQWMKHRKMTTNVICKGSGITGCSIGQSHSTSYTESYDFSVSPVEWISAGYSVSKSVSDGTITSCSIAKGHTGCVWKKILFIQYGARNKKVVSCPSGTEVTYNPLRIRSPSKVDPQYCAGDAGCAYPVGYTTWNQL